MVKPSTDVINLNNILKWTFFLLVIGVIIERLMVLSLGYRLSSNITTNSMLILLTISSPLIMIVALSISLFFSFKNKSWAFVLIFFVNFYIFVNSLNDIISKQIQMSSTIFFSLSLFLACAIISFYFYYKINFTSKLKTKIQSKTFSKNRILMSIGGLLVLIGVFLAKITFDENHFELMSLPTLGFLIGIAGLYLIYKHVRALEFGASKK